jgi:hypothetical protein
VTIHTLYDGPAGTSRLVVTARPTAALAPQAQWLVQFNRCSKKSTELRQCAAWMPRPDAWDKTRWHPIGSRLIPSAVLATVETWLRGRPVGDFQATTTTTNRP